MQLYFSTFLASSQLRLCSEARKQRPSSADLAHLAGQDGAASAAGTSSSSSSSSTSGFGPRLNKGMRSVCFGTVDSLAICTRIKSDC